MASELYNIDVDPSQIYQQYSPPVTSISSVTNLGDTTIITTINGGGGGKATGPAITIGSNWAGVNFVASGQSLNLDILNAASARADLGAAASGINTDITQLNGASQVDVSSHYEVNGVQVVEEQQPAIANPAGGATVDAEARATVVEILDALRQHGLIDT